MGADMPSAGGRNYASAATAELIAWANGGDREAFSMAISQVRVDLLDKRPRAACAVIARLSPAVCEWADAHQRFTFGDAFEKVGDLDAAMRWYLEASERGDVDAPLAIGVLHERAGDLPEALNWFLLGAERGDSYAQDTAANYLYFGKAGAPDVQAARRWAAKGAAQGNKGAIEFLEFIDRETARASGAEPLGPGAGQMAHVAESFIAEIDALTPDRTGERPRNPLILDAEIKDAAEEVEKRRAFAVEAIEAALADAGCMDQFRQAENTLCNLLFTVGRFYLEARLALVESTDNMFILGDLKKASAVYVDRALEAFYRVLELHREGAILFNLALAERERPNHAAQYAALHELARSRTERGARATKLLLELKQEHPEVAVEAPARVAGKDFGAFFMSLARRFPRYARCVGVPERQLRVRIEAQRPDAVLEFLQFYAEDPEMPGEIVARLLSTALPFLISSDRTTQALAVARIASNRVSAALASQILHEARGALLEVLEAADRRAAWPRALEALGSFVPAEPDTGSSVVDWLERCLQRATDEELPALLAAGAGLRASLDASDRGRVVRLLAAATLDRLLARAAPSTPGVQAHLDRLLEAGAGDDDLAAQVAAWYVRTCKAGEERAAGPEAVALGEHLLSCTKGTAHAAVKAALVGVLERELAGTRDQIPGLTKLVQLDPGNPSHAASLEGLRSRRSKLRGGVAVLVAVAALIALWASSRGPQ